MCLSVSGRLRLRRPSCEDSLRTALIAMEASYTIRLSAGFLGRQSELDELCDDDVAMLALNFDDALAHRAARSAALFELGRERLDLRRRQRQAAHDRDALAGAALGFSRDPHRGGTCGTGRVPRADAVACRTPAVRTQRADAGRVDDSRTHRRHYAPISPARDRRPLR